MSKGAACAKEARARACKGGLQLGMLSNELFLVQEAPFDARLPVKDLGAHRVVVRIEEPDEVPLASLLKFSQFAASRHHNHGGPVGIACIPKE